MNCSVYSCEEKAIKVFLFGNNELGYCKKHLDMYERGDL